jgi:hypothetical protein
MVPSDDQSRNTGFVVEVRRFPVLVRKLSLAAVMFAALVIGGFAGVSHQTVPVAQTCTITTVTTLPNGQPRCVPPSSTRTNGPKCHKAHWWSRCVYY